MTHVRNIYLIIVSLVLIILHGVFTPSKIFAQEDLNICESITAIPSTTVDSNNPQDVRIDVVIANDTIFTMSELTILYDKWDTPFTGRQPLSGIQANGNTLYGTIPASEIEQGKDGQGFEVEVVTVKGKQTVRMVSGSSRCAITVYANKATVSPTNILSCLDIFSGVQPPNYGDCRWISGENHWIPFDGCDGDGLTFPQACFSTNPDPLQLSEPDPLVMCLLCIPDNLVQNKRRGEMCTLNQYGSDCDSNYECRPSAYDEVYRCLWPMGTRPGGTDCYIGDNECGRDSLGSIQYYCLNDRRSMAPISANENGRCLDPYISTDSCLSDGQCVKKHGAGFTCDPYKLICIPPPTSTPPGNPTLALSATAAAPTFHFTPVPTNPYETPTPIGPNSFDVIKCDFSGKEDGVQTAFGCLPASPGDMATFFFQIAIGIAGGIAFLLIILGGMRILTSAGNPETMNVGKEIITSAIAGLLLIIFSVFILRVVGVDILGIPGFSA